MIMAPPGLNRILTAHGVNWLHRTLEVRRRPDQARRIPAKPGRVQAATERVHNGAIMKHAWILLAAPLLVARGMAAEPGQIPALEGERYYAEVMSFVREHQGGGK